VTLLLVSRIVLPAARLVSRSLRRALFLSLPGILMVGLDHGPASSGKQDSPEVAARNARIGLVLFFIYVALYAGFVACAVAGTLSMPIGGTNLAVWYGFGLIAAAFVLALVYGVLCRSRTTDRTEDAK
jgi:uncharacterized membrane protein (DUF485 family)